ncbi:MAG TPA: LCP family protein [Candidatus Saccharimonadales bacterium]|nr:LCP family protein [Candidatus Saccharimonadales bacterium]
MKKAVIFGIIVALLLLVGGFLVFKAVVQNKSPLLSPLVIKAINAFPDPTKPKVPASDLANKDIVNILLIGIDRRSKDETSFRSDTMILLSINTKNKRAVLTSVPRDLWVGGGRINALYASQGYEGIKNEFYKLTGQMADRYILTDFADFTWIVDAMDGVPVNVVNTFTDTEFPVDATLGYQTVTFTQGTEKLTGDRAIIYARSRHGNNGEGSDFMRQRRQHQILVGMLSAVLQPKSIFNPMVVENALKTVTTGRMETNISLADANFLWSFYKDKDLYKIESLYLESPDVFNPPMSDYGGAWVLIPTDPTNATFSTKVKNALLGIVDSSQSTASQSSN